MDRKRKVAARQAAGKHQEPQLSDSDEDLEMPVMPQPAQRASARRTNPRVDLSKLDASSLRRYRKVYKLGEAPPNSTKEELLVPVNRHFQSYLQVSDESDTLLNFALAVKKASLQNGIPGGAPLATMKKPRGAAANGKAKPIR